MCIKGWLFRCIFWPALLIAQNSNSQANFSAGSFFYGHRFPYSTFVSHSGDYLIAEIFYIDKRPREYFCDTLVVEEDRFIGKFSEIVRNKNQYYLSFNKNGFGRKIRIRNDKESYDKLNSIKNDYRAYMYEQQEKY
jgi:hypothetical protein